MQKYQKELKEELFPVRLCEKRRVKRNETLETLKTFSRWECGTADAAKTAGGKQLEKYFNVRLCQTC